MLAENQFLHPVGTIFALYKNNSSVTQIIS